ncbi:hypothetical protein AB0C02_30010 [Micromonospora sp. NPDC048999]|uniref:hypothetical protein n=1 Tax=Micromonospora sp. NPDC048999 TaxID=3155391 RepID=UPI0033DC9521
MADSQYSNLASTSFRQHGTRSPHVTASSAATGQHSKPEPTRWLADITAGRHSMMVVDTTEEASDIAHHARNLLITAGRVRPGRAVRLHDGNQASVGDIIVTRRNDRRIAAGPDYVTNRDQWRINAITRDGQLHVTNITTGTGTVLPAAYTARHTHLASRCRPRPTARCSATRRSSRTSSTRPPRRQADSKAPSPAAIPPAHSQPRPAHHPTRVSPDRSRQRLARHRPAERWPGVRVVT